MAQPAGVDGLTFEMHRIDEGIGAELVLELLTDLEARYGGPDPFAPPPLDLTPPRGMFVVAYLDGRPVACGGIRPHTEPDAAELKRMYTRPDARRRGVGRELLARLERGARDLGYERIVLETGTKQPEAIALYERLGYTRCEPFGQYKDYTNTRCFEKVLDATR
jgi:GNAT superfamily N-acetyltransferase